MKKTIIALVAIAAYAAASDEVTYTINTGLKASNTGGDGYNQVELTLSDALFAGAANNVKTTASDGGSAFTTESVDLTSISFMWRNATDSYANLTLTITDSNNNIVAISSSYEQKTKYQQADVFDSTYFYTNPAGYFSFSNSADKALIIGTTYTLTFSSEDENFNGVNLMASANLGSGISLINPTNYSKQSYLPANMVIVASAIPEPATATLSLLALAGLAARRRRR